MQPGLVTAEPERVMWAELDHEDPRIEYAQDIIEAKRVRLTAAGSLYYKPRSLVVGGTEPIEWGNEAVPGTVVVLSQLTIIQSEGDDRGGIKRLLPGVPFPESEYAPPAPRLVARPGWVYQAVNLLGVVTEQEGQRDLVTINSGAIQSRRRAKDLRPARPADRLRVKIGGALAAFKLTSLPIEIGKTHELSADPDERVLIRVNALAVAAAGAELSTV